MEQKQHAKDCPHGPEKGETVCCSWKARLWVLTNSLRPQNPGHHRTASNIIQPKHFSVIALCAFGHRCGRDQQRHVPRPRCGGNSDVSQPALHIQSKVLDPESHIPETPAKTNPLPHAWAEGSWQWTTKMTESREVWVQGVGIGDHGLRPSPRPGQKKSEVRHQEFLDASSVVTT